MAWDDFLDPLRRQVKGLIGQNAVLLAQHGGQPAPAGPAGKEPPQKTLPACLPAGFKDTVETHHNLAGPKSVDRRYDLSSFKPGDLLHTPGADVRICMDGRPEVTLRPGYENGRAAGREGPVLVPSGPPGVSLDSNMGQARRNGPGWFLQQVPNRHPWDYKQRDYRYQAFGNFNYGSAGHAVGLPRSVLERGAGWAQQRDHRKDPHPEFGAPFPGSRSYGDDPADQFWVEQGTRYGPVR